MSFQKSRCRSSRFPRMEKVKAQINALDEFDDLTRSCEAASEECELPQPKYEDILLLIDGLRMECTDSVSLLKIQDAVHSYHRLIKLKISHCELLRRNMDKMENKVNALQKELSETKEVKSQLEHEKIKQEQELFNLRFGLKQEEVKRHKADWLYDKNKEELWKKEEQYNKEVEVKQQLENSLRTLDTELKTVRSNLSQLQEAQDRHKEDIRSAKKLKDHLQKLELENSKLKVTIKKQAVENDHLQKSLLSKNMELLSMKTIEKKYFKLERNKKKMEQEIVNLKCNIEKIMVEWGEVLQYKQTAEEQARQDLVEKLKQVNEFLQTEAEVRSQMEVKLKYLETELSERRSQEESHRLQLSLCQEACLEGFRVTRSLSGQLQEANERLETASRELRVEKRRNSSVPATISAGPLLGSPCVGIHKSLILNRSCIPRQNLASPASNLWPSTESGQNCESRGCPDQSKPRDNIPKISFSAMTEPCVSTDCPAAFLPRCC